jgi:serine/threonine-protein kinase RsbW
MVELVMATSSTLRIFAERKNLAEVRRFLDDTLTGWQIAPLVIDKLRLAVDEAATNIIMHGYQEHAGDIEIRLQHSPDVLTIVIRDHASPFDPTAVACPDLSAGHSLLGQLPGGLGIALIREAVDVMRYCVAEDGANELTLMKSLVEEGDARRR